MRRLLIGLFSAALLVPCSSTAQPWLHEVVEAARGQGADGLVAQILGRMHDTAGERAPDLRFVPLGESDTLSLADVRGEATIVMFWHTNCSGCRMQIPELTRVYDAYKDEGLDIIYISDEPAPDLQAYLQENRVGGMVERTERATLTSPYQFLATPSAYLLDGSGRIREAWVVPKDFEELDELTGQLFGER
jgi:peroxiredoxin